MPRRTSRDNAQAHIEVLATLPQKLIPPRGPIPLPMHLGAHLRHNETTGEVETWAGPKRADLSDSPHFESSRMTEAPAIDDKTGDITMRHQIQFMLDPEKHIERTSNYPGATGHSGPYERYDQQEQGNILPYGGSTDARPEMTLSHRPTSEVWQGKYEDVAHPADATRKQFHPLTGLPVRTKSGSTDIPVHGRGLLDAVRAEGVRSPAHLIIDPNTPEYGLAALLTTSGGQHLEPKEKPDWGGFGHSEPVQWEGHHRVAAAALEQRRRREAGEENWSVPVPYEMHLGVPQAMASGAGIKAREIITEQEHKKKKAGRQTSFLTALRGGGTSAGTWNSKAY